MKKPSYLNQTHPQAQEYYLQGKKAFKAENYENALDYFNKAIASDYKHTPSYQAMAKIYTLKNNHLLAKKYNLFALEMGSSQILNLLEDAQELYSVAGALCKLDHGEAALNAVNDALQLQPDHFLALYMKGIITDSLGYKKSCVEIFKKVLEIEVTPTAELRSDYCNIYYKMGNILFFSENIEEALKAYKKAIVLNPNHLETKFQIALILEDKLGNHEEALEAYNEVLKLNPGHAQTHFNKGAIYHFLRKKDEAIKAFKETIKFDHNNHEAYCHLGDYSKKLPKDEAIKYYKNAIKLKPDYFEAYHNLGNLLFSLGNFKEAIIALTKAIELDPKHYSPYYNLGQCYNAFETIDSKNKALESYKNAIKLKSDYCPAYEHLGYLLFSLGNFNEALAVYQKAVVLKPTSLEINIQIASILSKLGKTEETLKAYDKVLELDPSNATAYYNKGIILASLNKQNEAIKAFKKTIEYDPNDYGAYYNLSKYAEKLPDEEVIQYYKKIIELKSDDFAVYNNLGNLFISQGRIIGALEVLAKALKLELNPKYQKNYHDIGKFFQGQGLIKEASIAYINAFNVGTEKLYPLEEFVKIGLVKVDLVGDHFD